MASGARTRVSHPTQLPTNPMQLALQVAGNCFEGAPRPWILGLEPPTLWRASPAACSGPTALLSSPDSCPHLFLRAAAKWVLPWSSPGVDWENAASLQLESSLPLV
jgi:hypothetical protein